MIAIILGGLLGAAFVALLHLARTAGVRRAPHHTRPTAAHTVRVEPHIVRPDEEANDAA